MEYHGMRGEDDSRFVPKRGRAMASPFPGMDPYLEYHWGDIYSGLVIYIREAVAKSCRAARCSRRRTCGDGNRRRDCAESPPPRWPWRVVEYKPNGSVTSVPAGAVVVAEPLLLRAVPEPLTENFIEIIDVKSGNRVVTVIEVLSPTIRYRGMGSSISKKTTGTMSVGYQPGRDRLGGAADGMSSRARGNTSRLGRQTPYLVCVRRATAKEIAEVYPIPLQERLADD